MGRIGKSEMSGKEGKWTWEEDGMTVVRSTARTGPGCHEGCGVFLYVKDGKLVKVGGNPDFPFSQGRLCPRCLALTEVVYHPDRLQYPLKRVGERGEGKWARITWDEAYDTIARKFNDLKKEYGADITLMGNFEIGGVLAFGTPDDVREETKQLLEKMMPGYGYVAMSSNSVANCVVPENYMAMVETVLEFGNY